MGYKQRGLTLKELQEQGRRIAKEGGSVRDMAIMIAEDNFAKGMVYDKYSVLSQTNRAAILRKVNALSLNDKHEYNYYLSFARSLFIEIPRIEETRNIFRKNWIIVLSDIQELATAEKYAVLLNTITPTLKEGGVYDKVSADLLGMRDCWRARVEFMTKEDGTQEVGGKILSDIRIDAKRMRIQLKRYLTYENVLKSLTANKKLAAFVPDYALDCLNLLYENYLPCKEFGEEYLFKLETELKQMKLDKASKDLILQKENYIFNIRRYAVIPDRERVRFEITPEEEITMYREIMSRVDDKR